MENNKMCRYKIVTYIRKDLTRLETIFTDDIDFMHSCKHRKGYITEIYQWIDLWEEYISLSSDEHIRED